MHTHAHIHTYTRPTHQHKLPLTHTPHKHTTHATPPNTLQQYFLLVPFVAAGYRSGKPHLRKAAKYFVWACLLVCILTSWILTIKVRQRPKNG